MRRAARSASAVLAFAAVLCAVPAALAFDPATEALNFAKITERQVHLTSRPDFQVLMAEQNVRDQIEYHELLLSDPERNFSENLCAHRTFECAGDVRFYDWAEKGQGIVRPVLFGARNGATLSGTVWAARQGPRKRAAVVITTGGLAPETLYWGFAASLASHGYVVLTYDVQGQGRSDAYGEGPDRDEAREDNQLFAHGQPFYDGTEDALGFLLSTRARPYRPRPSCGNANDGTPTNHLAKHRRRVREGRNAAFNPLHRLVDRKRIGLAGHSQGAGAVSYIGQRDRRVDALVAWDHLDLPTDPPAECPARPQTRTDAKITKPGLGLAGDYHQPPEPYTSEPDPDAKSEAFEAYQHAGVESMNINIRGGTHYEFSFMAGYATTYPFGTATLRGYDMVAWYTRAWLDRYVRCKGRRCKRRAMRRVLTNRWQSDARTGQIDPNGDPNMFSFYLRSRYSLRRPLGGRRIVCPDMRAGCRQMGPDGRADAYDLYADAFRRGR